MKHFKDVRIDGITFKQINPRESFRVWTQLIKDHCSPWTNNDLASAEILGERLYQVLVRNAQLLEAHNRQLQVAYSEMDNFMHSVSHDISNLLTAIKLNSQVILRQTPEPKIQDKAAAIDQQADKISKMLSQFRELSKSTSEEVLKEDIEMPLMIFDIFDEIIPRYAAKNTAKIIGELHNIYRNEVAVYQIFSNIIGNAIKYSSRREEPVIRVESFLDEKFIYYRIYDNGIGIPGDSENIFEAFGRDASAKNFEGSGIGLSIVKNLIIRQNASINYISCMDEGSCFYLKFQNPKNRLLSRVAIN